MKTIAIRGVVAASACAAALCLTASADSVTQERKIAPNEAAPYSSPLAESPSDGQIVGIMETVNQSEIEAADLAERKSSNGTVLEFARMAKTDHTDAADRLSSCNVTSKSGELNAMFKERTARTAKRLEKLDGAAFDRAYIAAQVDDHTAVLDKIDRKFIPAAKSADVSTYLRETRPIIEAHLEHARRIKTELGTK